MHDIKERKVYLDYLRILSMFSVVFIHIFVTARTDFVNHTQFEEMLCYIVSGIFHFAVPIFFMITGCLFLNPNKIISLKDLFLKYIKKYVFVILLFGFGFAVIEQILNNGFSIISILIGFSNMLQGKSWNHMWYLYTLVGIMMFIPFLKLIVNKDDEKYTLTKYLLVLVIIFSSVFPIIKSLFGFEFGITFPVQSVYIAYLILGFLIGMGKIKIKNSICILMIIICVITFALVNVLSIILDMEVLRTISSYISPVIMLMAISIFSLLKNLTKRTSIDVEKNSNKFLMLLSNCSFGVYILHMFWINVIYKLIKMNIFGDLMELKVIGIYICVVVLSLLSTMILKKIPLIKNII